MAALVSAETEDKYPSSKHDVEGLTKGERKPRPSHCPPPACALLPTLGAGSREDGLRVSRNQR